MDVFTVCILYAGISGTSKSLVILAYYSNPWIRLKIWELGAIINNKDFAGAIEVYSKIMAEDPTNAMASLRLGMAYGATGNTEAAEAAYLVAAENGQEKNAYKQLSNLLVKQAAAVLKTKK